VEHCLLQSVASAHVVEWYQIYQAQNRARIPISTVIS
jgi:hypothetical protein